MIHQWLTLLWCFASLSCAVKTAEVSPCPPCLIEPEPETLPVVLMGSAGAAHACPVDLGEGLLVTAGHVAYRSVLSNGEIINLPKVYLAEDEHGHIGRAAPSGANNYVDIALMVTDLDDLKYYPLGVSYVGDKVYWYEYSYKNAKSIYQNERREAKVSSVRVNHYFFDKAPLPGASGTCLFNEAGHVIGIISWYQSTDNNKVVGAAVGIQNLLFGE